MGVTTDMAVRMGSAMDGSHATESTPRSARRLPDGVGNLSSRPTAILLDGRLMTPHRSAFHHERKSALTGADEV